MKKFIYKICKTDEWTKAKKKRKFIGNKKDVMDGFIHFSKKTQVRSTLKKYFLNIDNLILLKVDATKIDNLIFEKSSSGAFFPHLYSDLNLNCIKKTYKIILKKDGYHYLPSTF